MKWPKVGWSVTFATHNTYHPEDAALNDDFPLIALDLDTNSLGPLIAHLSGLHAMRAEDSTATLTL